MRTVIIAILAVALGAAAGAWVMRTQLQDQLSSALAEKQKLENELAEARANAVLPAEREKALQSEIEALRAQVQTLEQQRVNASATPTDAQFLPSPPPGFDPTEVTGEQPQDAATDRGERRGPRDRESTDAERQERAERWREMQQQFRERIDSFFQDQYNAAPDAASKERIAQLQQYTDYMAQLRDSMRNAATEEEREAIRQAMRETGANMAEIARQQREHMMRQLAQQYGITDSNQQEAFIQALQNMESNPIYRGGGMLGGLGGPGGPGGGPGGPFWGGGRR